MQHHTFKRLPNGNTLILGWEKVTKKEAIKAGRDPKNVPSKPSEYFGLNHNDFWMDFVIEVNKAGKLVWKWRTMDHVGTGKDQLDLNYILPEGLGAPYTDLDWSHFNSLDYIPETDQIVMNSRNFSEFFLVNHKTGKIEYRWGNPSTHGEGKRPTWYNNQSQKVFGSHHASYIGKGRVMVFDNGSERAESNLSRSVIVDIKSGKIVWEYQANDSTSFFSYRQGASQMLPNGNVLVTSSNHGHIFEVTPDKKVVWDFVNPIFRGNAKCVVYDEDVSLKHNFMTNMVHRAYRYGVDYPGLKGRELTPGPYICGDDCPRFFEAFHRGAEIGGAAVVEDDEVAEDDEDLMMNAY